VSALQEAGARTRAAEAAVPRSAWWRAARLWVVVVGFLGVGIARSVQVGIPFRDPDGAVLTSRILLTLAVFLGLLALDGLLRTGRPRNAQRLWSTVRERWTPGRLALAWAALLAYHLTYFTYRNLKSWDVLNAPRDAMLTGWDRWLFLGHSPAVLVHDLLGQQAAAWVLMAWYETFPSLVIVAFPAAVVMATRIRDAYVGMAAFVWVWILGTASYYLIPSLGPFSAEAADFAGLPHMVIQDNQARYLSQRAHLLAHPQASDAFAGVSAFASLHVGVTATILGLAWWHGLRRTTIALGVFLAGTMVATVYLGWHFAVDVPAGLLIAALAWWLAPRTVGVRGRPPARGPAVS
jgi:membrane-associated phospholipid phosphatase